MDPSNYVVPTIGGSSPDMTKYIIIGVVVIVAVVIIGILLLKKQNSQPEYNDELMARKYAEQQAYYEAMMNHNRLMQENSQNPKTEAQPTEDKSSNINEPQRTVPEEGVEKDIRDSGTG